MFLTAVRHEVNNLESSVVLQEPELAINLALYFFKLTINCNIGNKIEKNLYGVYGIYNLVLVT